MHASNKRKRNSTSRKSSSNSAKKAKVTVHLNAEELSKEMIVGYGLDKQWYESTSFPQLHAILQTQFWETLMAEHCCNPMYPELIREFVLNFSVHNGVCTSSIKNVKIEFNGQILGEWLGVPATGFDVYYVGSKIFFSVIDEKNVWKFLGINEKRGKVSHNILYPVHKLLYNIARRFILPQNSKRSEVNLRDATLIYCMANNIKINFPSLMISYLSGFISKRCVIGYGGLLTWTFRKLGVPLEGQNFPMGPNNMIGAKCLSNLHLKLNENRILENVAEQINVHSDDKEEQEEERSKKEEQEPVPSAIEKVEGCSKE